MRSSRRYQFTVTTPEAVIGRRLDPRRPTIPPAPPDPLGRCPVELDRAPGPTDDPDRTRNADCVHVDHCLDRASKWAGFSCVACRFFGVKLREIDHFGARRTDA